MPKKVTLNEFKERGNIIHNNFYEYEKSVYISTNKKLIITCPIHGDFMQTPSNHIKGAGCKKCGCEKLSKSKTSSLEDVLIKANNIHKNFYNYSNILEYKGQKTKYSILCPTHGEFIQSLSDHLAGKGCNLCGIESSRNLRRGDIITLKNKWSLMFKDFYDYSKVEYYSQDKKIVITCPTHGDFTQTPNSHGNGSGCPKCAKIQSKPETEVYNFINSKISSIQGNRQILKNRHELDIYIPSLKVAIEYNGLYFHSDNFHNSKYHLNKTKQCQEKEIKLIHIFEDEWIHKKEIVKSILLEAIGKTEKVISIDNCEVKTIDQEEYKQFLLENNLEGYIEANEIFGLYYNDELVSTIGKSDFLVFCRKLNTRVTNGFEKLLEYFKGNLISYVDLRWSQGELEESLGFKLESQTAPNFYYTKGQVRTKNKEEGFNKIYDCGSLKYVKTK